MTIAQIRRMYELLRGYSNHAKIEVHTLTDTDIVELKIYNLKHVIFTTGECHTFSLQGKFLGREADLDD